MGIHVVDDGNGDDDGVGGSGTILRVTGRHHSSITQLQLNFLKMNKITEGDPFSTLCVCVALSLHTRSCTGPPTFSGRPPKSRAQAKPKGKT